MHIKDALYSTGGVVPPGQGDGHVKEVLHALYWKGYQGFVSLEPHLGKFEGLADLELDDFGADLPEGGPKMFAVAATALQRIINEIEG
jgi:sugar phosphate isomerase/epimerase